MRDQALAFDPAPKTMTINVAAVNDAPVANNVLASGNEDDAQIAITLTGADVDGPIASFRLRSLPANGMLYTDPGLTTLASVGPNYAAAGNALTLYFVPAADWSGSTGFQFTATDAGGLADATPATATINVAAVNDAPVANNVLCQRQRGRRPDRDHPHRRRRRRADRELPLGRLSGERHALHRPRPHDARRPVPTTPPPATR